MYATYKEVRGGSAGGVVQSGSDGVAGRGGGTGGGAALGTVRGIADGVGAQDVAMGAMVPELGVDAGGLPVATVGGEGLRGAMSDVDAQLSITGSASSCDGRRGGDLGSIPRSPQTARDVGVGEVGSVGGSAGGGVGTGTPPLRKSGGLVGGEDGLHGTLNSLFERSRESVTSSQAHPRPPSVASSRSGSASASRTACGDDGSGPLGGVALDSCDCSFAQRFPSPTTPTPATPTLPSTHAVLRRIRVDNADGSTLISVDAGDGSGSVVVAPQPRRVSSSATPSRVVSVGGVPLLDRSSEVGGPLNLSSVTGEEGMMGATHHPAVMNGEGAGSGGGTVVQGSEGGACISSAPYPSAAAAAGVVAAVCPASLGFVPLGAANPTGNYNDGESLSFAHGGERLSLSDSAAPTPPLYPGQGATHLTPGCAQSLTTIAGCSADTLLVPSARSRAPTAGGAMGGSVTGGPSAFTQVADVGAVHGAGPVPLPLPPAHIASAEGCSYVRPPVAGVIHTPQRAVDVSGGIVGSVAASCGANGGSFTLGVPQAVPPGTTATIPAAPSGSRSASPRHPSCASLSRGDLCVASPGFSRDVDTSPPPSRSLSISRARGTSGGASAAASPAASTRQLLPPSSHSRPSVSHAPQGDCLALSAAQRAPSVAHSHSRGSVADPHRGASASRSRPPTSAQSKHRTHSIARSTTARSRPGSRAGSPVHGRRSSIPRGERGGDVGTATAPSKGEGGVPRRTSVEPSDNLRKTAPAGGGREGGGAVESASGVEGSGGGAGEDAVCPLPPLELRCRWWDVEWLATAPADVHAVRPVVAHAAAWVSYVVVASGATPMRALRSLHVHVAVATLLAAVGFRAGLLALASTFGAGADEDSVRSTRGTWLSRVRERAEWLAAFLASFVCVGVTVSVLIPATGEDAVAWRIARASLLSPFTSAAVQPTDFHTRLYLSRPGYQPPDARVLRMLWSSLLLPLALLGVGVLGMRRSPLAALTVIFTVLSLMYERYLCLSVPLLAASAAAAVAGWPFNPINALGLRVNRSTVSKCTVEAFSAAVDVLLDASGAAVSMGGTPSLTAKGSSRGTPTTASAGGGGGGSGTGHNASGGGSGGAGGGGSGSGSGSGGGDAAQSVAGEGAQGEKSDGRGGARPPPSPAKPSKPLPLPLSTAVEAAATKAQAQAQAQQAQAHSQASALAAAAATAATPSAGGGAKLTPPVVSVSGNGGASSGTVNDADALGRDPAAPVNGSGGTGAPNVATPPAPTKSPASPAPSLSIPPPPPPKSLRGRLLRLSKALLSVLTVLRIAAGVYVVAVCLATVPVHPATQAVSMEPDVDVVDVCAVLRKLASAAEHGPFLPFNASDTASSSKGLGVATDVVHGAPLRLCLSDIVLWEGAPVVRHVVHPYFESAAARARLFRVYAVMFGAMPPAIAGCALEALSVDVLVVSSRMCRAATVARVRIVDLVDDVMEPLDDPQLRALMGCERQGGAAAREAFAQASGVTSIRGRRRSRHAGSERRVTQPRLCARLDPGTEALPTGYKILSRVGDLVVIGRVAHPLISSVVRSAAALVVPLSSLSGSSGGGGGSVGGAGVVSVGGVDLPPHHAEYVSLALSVDPQAVKHVLQYALDHSLDALAAEVRRAVYGHGVFGPLVTASAMRHVVEERIALGDTGTALAAARSGAERGSGVHGGGCCIQVAALLEGALDATLASDAACSARLVKEGGYFHFSAEEGSADATRRASGSAGDGAEGGEGEAFEVDLDGLDVDGDGSVVATSSFDRGASADTLRVPKRDFGEGLERSEVAVWPPTDTAVWPEVDDCLYQAVSARPTNAAWSAAYAYAIWTRAPRDPRIITLTNTILRYSVDAGPVCVAAITLTSLDPRAAQKAFLTARMYDARHPCVISVLPRFHLAPAD